MKTVISIPDELFNSVEVLAEEKGLSRNELYAFAIEEYVAKHRKAEITTRLDAVYGEEDNRLASAVRRAQASAVQSADW